MLLEMAILWGNEGDRWYLKTIEVPDSFRGKSYAELNEIGRQKIYSLPQYDNITGCYLFNDDVLEE